MKKAIVRFIFLIFLFLVFPFHVLAANYNDGTYGYGDYNIGELTPTPTNTPTATPTPTTTPTNTPTPTPTPNNNNSSSSNNSSSPSAPGCGNNITSDTPNLFEIRTDKDTATLFFSPPPSPYSSFYVAYSRKSDTFEYGTEYNQSYSGGVLKYTISKLQPNTKYYFKIRAGNGCATGNWGNTMVASTTNNSKQTRAFYKSTNILTKIVNLVKKTTNSLLPNKKVTIIQEEPKIINIDITPIVKPINTVAPKTEVPIPTSNKKFCIFQWCF